MVNKNLMKKFIGFLIVLGLFVLGTEIAKAAVSVNTSTVPCVTSANRGNIVVSLDANSPANMIVSPGSNNVEVLRIALTNTSQENVCLNGIHLGSSENVNKYINKTTVFDVATDLQVGQTSYSFSNNGSYYYSWILPTSSISIVSGATKVFKVVSDFSPTAMQGELKMGNWGLNFDRPGSTMSPQVVSGNIISVNNGASNGKPSVTVLSPNGGETFVAGQQITVKWTSKNIPTTDMMNISISNGTVNSPSLATVNDGEEVYTIPANFSPNTDYVLFVTTYSGIVNYAVDNSDNFFTIKKFETANCNPSSVPSITVLSPNGGEVYTVGQNVNFTWKSCNIPSTVHLNVQLISENNPEDSFSSLCEGGSSTWGEACLNDGQQKLETSRPGVYKLNIVTREGVAVSDMSDNSFTIKNSEISTVLPDGCNSAAGFSPTTGLPCFLDTYSATSITKNGAVLNGRLIANAPAEMYFIYAKTGNGNKVQRTEKITQQSNGLFSYTLSSLSPNTSYDFKACMYYAGAERCARQLTFKTFPASYIPENDGCKNSEIYSSTTGQKCLIPVVLEQKCDPATDCYKKEVPNETQKVCDSAAGCPQKETPVVTTPPCNSPAGCSNTSSQLTRTLKIGTKGEDVKYIQTLLGITADGSYGPVTAQKVKEWQAKNMLKADGIFGAQSMSIISQ